MNALDWLTLSIVLMLCGAGTMTDLRIGKVRNAHLLIALMLGLAIAGVHAFQTPPSMPNCLTWCVNVLCAVGAALILYIMDIWAPGDAKMYLCLAMLYPRGAYVARPGNVFPALNFLIQSFALGYLFLIFTGWGRRRKITFSAFTPSKKQGGLLRYGCNLGFLVGMQTLVSYWFPAFFEDNQIFCLLIGIVSGLWLSRKLPIVWKWIGAAGFLWYLIDIALQRIWLESAFVLLVSLLLAWLMECLDNLARSTSYREIDAKDVRAGMILSHVSILAMQHAIDPHIPRVTTETRRSRLSSLQAEAIRRWGAKTKEPLSIVEMLPFAPFIALSVLVELVRYGLFVAGRG
ncbi:MAG: hypothetical protein RR150_09340 [Clostridia bacterium]